VDGVAVNVRLELYVTVCAVLGLIAPFAPTDGVTVGVKTINVTETV
jgi:hypothetical protein